MAKKKKVDLVTALRAAADTHALRAYAKQRKDAQPFKRCAAEFTKRLRSDAAGAAAWLAEQYVAHYRPKAEQNAADRAALARWQKEAKVKTAGENRALGAALAHLQRLSIESHIDMSIEGGFQPIAPTRLTDSDLRSVKRVFEKARKIVAEMQGNMLEGPPTRKRGRAKDELNALQCELIELLRCAGLTKAATAKHVGKLLHPGNVTQAERTAGSIQSKLSTHERNK